MKRHITAFAVSLSLLAGGCQPASSPGSRLGTVDEGRSVAAAIAAAGLNFEPLSSFGSPDGSPGSVTSHAAVTVATGAFGHAETPVVFGGLLTVPDVEPPISHRPAFAVQLTGMRQGPMGQPVTEESVHNELVVFVDAASGELLMAVTVR